jgi:DNA repair exonuclease SbcCD ATPase subunit
MLLKPWKTALLMSPDDTPGGGQTSTELPEALKDKYVSVDKFNGTKGALEQQIGRWRSEAEKLSGEKSAFESQLTSLNEQLSQLKTEAEKVGGLGQQLSEVQNGLQAQQSLNARLRAAMKFPQLLGGDLAESTLALIESSTMEAAALEEHLGKLAASFGAGAGTVNPASGATPPQPKNSNPDPKALMEEAERARREGKAEVWEAKLGEALALMDAQKKFAPARRADAP